MDFTPVLSAFQGAIISADNVYQFSRLSEKGGNEDEIDYIVTTLSRFFEESLFIFDGKVQNTTEVRKFALYIVLNVDLRVIRELIAVEAISNLISTTPTITKCLMCEIMWNLNMDQFISEIISFAHPQLAIEVASAFLDNFKYFDPFDCLNQLNVLSTACYMLICRLYLFKLETPELISKGKAAFANFKRCLDYYTTPPNNYKLNSLNKADLYKNQGRTLFYLLLLMEESLSNYVKKLDLNTPGDGFYKITYTNINLNDEALEFNVCDSTNNVLLEYINNANVAMLDTCKVLVMDVSVDVFCCWSEFIQGGKSMQQNIGELCYRVHNKLLSLSTVSDHPVVSMFEQISRKPVEMKDKINATDDDVIESNVNQNNNESKEWLKALIYKEKLCKNLKLLNLISSHLDKYNNDESYMLFSALKLHADSEMENKDFVEALSVRVFQNCDTRHKYLILEEHFRSKTLRDMKETAEFQSDMTSIFNRISSSGTDFTDVLKLFLQSPQKVYTKIFALACENTQQTEIMLKVMRLFQRFTDHYYTIDTEPCIIRICQNRIDSKFDTITKESNFVKFVCGLKETNIISGTQLFLLIIMANMHKKLLSKEILDLRVTIKLLKKAFKIEELLSYRAPLLAMLAQVMDVVRWKMNTFSVAAVVVLHTTIDLLTPLLTTYNGFVPERESKWLKRRLVTLQPLNLYYFKILWNPPGTNYLEVVSGMTIEKSMDLNVLSIWMAQVICVCTRQEWADLYDCLSMFGHKRVLKVFHDAVAYLTNTQKSTQNENTKACVAYTHRLFIYIIRFKFFRDPITDDQIRVAITRVASLYKMAANSDEFLGIFVPFISFIVEKKTFHVTLRECLTEHFANTDLWPMINETFSAQT